MEILFVWLGLSVAVGVVAERRGRNGFGWVLFSVFLSPLLGFIFVLALPKVGEAAAAVDETGAMITEKTHVRCPDCRELVRRDARKCKHCGASLVPQVAESMNDLPAIVPARPPSRAARGFGMAIGRAVRRITGR